MQRRSRIKAKRQSGRGGRRLRGADALWLRWSIKVLLFAGQSWAGYSDPKVPREIGEQRLQR